MAALRKHELALHLEAFQATPFLFVGSGLSRRYLNLDDWAGLLRRFAAVVGKPYEYYSSSADGDYLAIASLIAADLHPKWWADPEFEESRDEFATRAKSPESALKIEVAKSLRTSLDALPKPGDDLADELDLFKQVVVDGIITTNFDPLLEHLFPSFKVFVGQDELLFSDPQGIGEVYKIHGSVDEPDSLVLTTRDFDRFRERNAYLAAKLLTIFVEHPVVFLGYSMSDPNVIEILRSIASILTNERIAELRDRLIFVRWNEAAGSDERVTTSTITTDGYAIPVNILEVAEFGDVYRALGQIERKFPARVLRQLKEHVYELVRDNDPKGRLHVQDLEPGDDVTKVDVVLGVGAISRLVTSYKGKDRKDLLIDVVSNSDELDAAKVVEEVLPSVPPNAHVPIYKYLRGAGLLTNAGELRASASVDERVRKRVAKGTEPFEVMRAYSKRAKEAAKRAGSFEELAKSCTPREVLLWVAALPEDQIDPEQFRNYLVAHRQDQFEAGPTNLEPTQWAKAVCLYDWLVYGKAAARPRRRGGAKKPSKKAK